MLFGVCGGNSDLKPDMLQACHNLQGQFERCEQDLEDITNQLQREFEGNANFSKNPVDISRRLKALRDDLPKVQEDWKRVMIAKQSLIDSVRKHQVPNTLIFQDMCNEASLPVPDDDAAEKAAQFKSVSEAWEKENSSKLLSIREDLYSHMLLAPGEVDVQMLSTMALTSRPAEEDHAEDTAEAVEANDDQENVAPGQAEASPAAPQILLTAEEFTSVSTVVRGKCTLEECNMLLDKILSHARKSKGVRHFSTAELVKMGARVTGQTGGSRLATLRALKRISISKEGIAVNPKFLGLAF